MCFHRYLCWAVIRFIVISLVFPLLHCNSGSTDPEKSTDKINLTGSWEMSVTMTSNTCGFQPGNMQVEIIDLTDKDGALSIVNFKGLWGSGQFDGTNLQFNGTEISDDFGCEATISTEGTGTIIGANIKGSFMMSIVYHQDSCNNFNNCIINSDFILEKMEESPCLGRANFDEPQNSKYILPYPAGAQYPVYQSYCWSTGGHRNQLAIDFSMPIGDTVIASRKGVVKEVKDTAPDNGQGYGEHNYIYIQHEDKTLAFYAHLKQYSVVVIPGDTIEAGQYIALSGNSGQSGEPHLHIGVYQNFPPVEGVDVPINFRNAEGLLDSRNGLIKGEIYKALPY